MRRREPFAMTDQIVQALRAVLDEVASRTITADVGMLRVRAALGQPPPLALEPRALYSTHEAAKVFQVTPMTVIRWVDAGRLPAQRTVGGHRRIPAQSIATLCGELRVEVPEGVKAAIAA